MQPLFMLTDPISRALAQCPGFDPESLYHRQSWIGGPPKLEDR